MSVACRLTLGLYLIHSSHIDRIVVSNTFALDLGILNKTLEFVPVNGFCRVTSTEKFQSSYNKNLNQDNNNKKKMDSF